MIPVTGMLPRAAEAQRIRARLARRKPKGERFREPAPAPKLSDEEVLLAAARLSALSYAREMARARGHKMLELFNDSLEAELARRAVLRRLRREYQSIPFATLDCLIEETLSP